MCLLLNLNHMPASALSPLRFLRFVTGTPRLPPGGLAALQPRLTVVRKLSQAAMAGAGSGSAGRGRTAGDGWN